jgi:predicted MFS family arabinose efflux permease
MYVVAAEGLLFGVIAIVGAIAVLAEKRWARRLLLVASILLTLTAVVVIVMAPQKWDTQGIFIAWCLLLWWTSWKWKRQ